MIAMKVVRKIFLLCLLASAAATAEHPAPPPAGVVDGLVLAWLIAMPVTVTDVLVADTGASTLYRFERNQSGFRRVDSRYMSIGTNGVGKQRAWDRKTPLGVYFITHEMDTSRLPAKYGIAAYPLDYPNGWDRYQERTGNGIWLHGVNPATPKRPPLDTDGCLALPNDELARLAPLLEPLVTPVIVTRRMHWISPAKLEATRSGLLQALESWRTSAERADLLEHLGLYAAEFRYQGMDKALWAEYKQGVFASRGNAAIKVDEVMLIADPEEPGLFISRFVEVVSSGDAIMSITKRLYWRRSAENGWQIVTEDTG